MTIELTVEDRTVRIDPHALVVAGYTGADTDAVQHHIDELAAEGVAPPPRVPMYWAMPPSMLTQQPVIDVPSRSTSGEIELALVVDGPETFLAAGSDHTCREAEAIDIRLSKLICPTPLSSAAVRWADVADRWSELVLAATIVTSGGGREAYQSAAAGANRPPDEVLAGIPWTDDRPRSFVVLCGTVPAIGGIRPADRFEGTITDPAAGAVIELTYDIEPVAPLVAD